MEVSALYNLEVISFIIINLCSFIFKNMCKLINMVYSRHRKTEKQGL